MSTHAKHKGCTLWHVTEWIGYSALDIVRAVAPKQMKKPAMKRTPRVQQRLRVLSTDLRICWGLALRPTSSWTGC